MASSDRKHSLVFIGLDDDFYRDSPLFIGSKEVFLLRHVWQLPYEIVKVLMIKHYAIYIESGICSPLLAVGSQIWGGF